MTRGGIRVVVVAAVAVLGILQVASPGDAQLPPLPLGTTTTTQPPPPPPPPPPQYPPLPPDSGAGRRAVYSLDQQRVWIVEQDETVVGSWLVSGRKSIPKPGDYEVFSKSRWSRSGSVRMEFMVRFAHTSGDDIGFHAIPVDENGEPVQSESELGQPRSRGCVRQARADAERMWNWAPVGTAVRVTP